jgi:hypothetical protein
LLPVKRAWESLTALLMDVCKITSERFLRGGHNSLLPFVVYLVRNPAPGDAEKRRIAAGIYIALMSGVFASAEARMGTFSRDCVESHKPFPLRKLAKLVCRHRYIYTLDDLLSRHKELALNIAHGGITLDNNPDNLEKDHIFPRASMYEEGYDESQVEHYANLHFLRGSDNRNKSNTDPHEWFKNPGEQPAYSAKDLEARLLTWEVLQPGQFETMLEERARLIQNRALAIFGMTTDEFEGLFT